MNAYRCWLPMVLALVWASLLSLEAKNIRFCGYDWNVRTGRGGPGPNSWDDNNVWLDDSGRLHLKIACRDGKWSCAEISITNRLGYGQYEFQIIGPIDALDQNVVLGLFNYPTPDVGPDATHEIDIEFARWGNPANPIGNFTIWPVEKALKQTTKPFVFTLSTNSVTTHRFRWDSTQISFQSLEGQNKSDQKEFARWTYAPVDPARRISQKPMPIHINLWLFRGNAPKNEQEVEIILTSFAFRPAVKP